MLGVLSLRRPANTAMRVDRGMPVAARHGRLCYAADLHQVGQHFARRAFGRGVLSRLILFNQGRQDLHQLALGADKRGRISFSTCRRALRYAPSLRMGRGS